MQVVRWDYKLRNIFFGTSVLWKILNQFTCLHAFVCRMWMQKAARDLSNYQWRLVANAISKCSLPIFIKLVFAEICRWRSYTRPQETYLASTIMDSIMMLFERIEKQVKPFNYKILKSQNIFSTGGCWCSTHWHTSLRPKAGCLNPNWKIWSLWTTKFWMTFINITCHPLGGFHLYCGLELEMICPIICQKERPTVSVWWIGTTGTENGSFETYFQANISQAIQRRCEGTLFQE